MLCNRFNSLSNARKQNEMPFPSARGIEGRKKKQNDQECGECLKVLPGYLSISSLSRPTCNHFISYHVMSCHTIPLTH